MLGLCYFIKNKKIKTHFRLNKRHPYATTMLYQKMNKTREELYY